MNVKNMPSISIVIVLFIFLGKSAGQEKPNSSHPFSNSWVISGEGGITIGATDFPEAKIDYFGSGHVSLGIIS